MILYTDIDKHACAWLRELIRAGLIAPGDVDDRPIQEINPHELSGYTQCHFFAGVGGWPIALSLAGWGADRPVWTGSCPCQPFSVAGSGKGAGDDRHLWPDFARLIWECRPPAVFGEQVASKLGRQWLSGVRLDLEAMGYGVGAADLCAAGVGAPHIRQRLFWVAQSIGIRRGRGYDGYPEGHERGFDAHVEIARSGSACRLAHATSPRLITEGQGAEVKTRDETRVWGFECGCTDSWMVNTDGARRAACAVYGLRVKQVSHNHIQPSAMAPGAWDDYILTPCTDGKARRIKPGLEPLVDGLPGRASLLRGYGNAIVPQVAAEFVRAFMEVGR